MALAAWSATAAELKPGLYRHYKGPVYRLIGCARHSETEEELVVYHPQDDPLTWWARPLTMFTEELDIDGQRVKRFSAIN